LHCTHCANGGGGHLTSQVWIQPYPGGHSMFPNAVECFNEAGESIGISKVSNMNGQLTCISLEAALEDPNIGDL